MSADRLPGAVLPLLYVLAVLVLSGVGAVLVLRRERRDPSSCTRLGVPVGLPGEGPSPEEWAGMSAVEQEAWDNASLDAAEQAELDAEDGAREAAQFLAQRAEDNALFHP